MYKPRGSLARVLYDRCKTDEKVNDSVKIKWYEVKLSRIPQDLKSKFLQMSIDAETERFIVQSTDKSSRIFTQLWHCFVRTCLNLFLTQTSINGLLRRGSMFVFSLEQFLRLTSRDVPPPPPPPPSGGREPRRKRSPRRLLDLGAGDGVVTSVISELFDEVYVTEVSHPMKAILAEKGFRVLGIEDWATDEDLKFDVISCLNLLDRCDRPYDILRDARLALKPGGLVVFAIVLPFKSYVEVGRPDHSPTQNLDIRGTTFEEQVAEVAWNVLAPNGYEIVCWTKLPYLCEGDLRQSYYWLEDAVFVARPTD